MPDQNQTMSLADWHHRYLQQSRWTETIRDYLFNKINLENADWILEVGSGTGAVLSQITADFPCQTMGVDIDHKSLQFSQENNPTFDLTQADAHKLPFCDHVFSIAYCHYLLMWVNHPLDVLFEMRRVTQPGGAVIALAESDYAARIDFPPPLDRLGQLQTQSIQTQGADIAMGRRLGRLFYESGLADIEVGILGARWFSESSEEIDQTEWTTLRSDLEDTLTKLEIENYTKADRQSRKNAERVLFIPTFYAAGFV